MNIKKNLLISPCLQKIVQYHDFKCSLSVVYIHNLQFSKEIQKNDPWFDRTCVPRVGGEKKSFERRLEGVNV